MVQPAFFIKTPKPKKAKPVKVYGCEACGMYKHCKHKQIAGIGKGNKGIMIIGSHPDAWCDTNNVPLNSSNYAQLRDLLRCVDISLSDDCYYTNAVKCMPATYKKYNRLCYKRPDGAQIKSCMPTLMQEIQAFKPRVIICLGDLIFDELAMPKDMKKTTIKKYHGMAFPVHSLNAWVGACFDFETMAKNPEEFRVGFQNDFIDILAHMNYLLPLTLSRDSEANRLLLNSSEICDTINDMIAANKPVAFDYETVGVSAYAKNAAMITIGFSNDINQGYSFPVNYGSWDSLGAALVWDAWQKFLLSDVPKVVQNLNMEGSWSKKFFGLFPNNIIDDTMISQHTLYCRGGFSSLAVQTYKMCGDYYKDIVDVKDLINTPLSTVGKYNSLDARYTLMAYEYHKARLQSPVKEFTDFFVKSAVSLVKMKDRGIQINVDQLNEFEVESKTKLASFIQELKDHPLSVQYRQTYGEEVNMDSTKAFPKLLFEMCKEENVKFTKGGRNCVDADVIQTIFDRTKDKQVKSLLGIILQYRKIDGFVDKINEYKGLLDVDNKIHPNFWLNIAESYRSACGDPNAQNVYKHDEKLKVFRKCFVPSKGNIFIEADYNALEMAVIGMVSGDPVLGKQVRDDVNIHRYWASLLFKKAEAEVAKTMRQNAKNAFVFPSVYGSTPEAIARNLEGVTLAHTIATQAEFWKQYAHVKQWQEGVLKTYQVEGYIEAVTGFRRYAPLSKEQLYNSGIQGCAFHLLLDALNKIEDALDKYHMKSRPVIEVHDSLTFDTVPSEAYDLVQICTEIMLSKRFEWQRDVPLGVTWELGDNWYDMHEFDKDTMGKLLEYKNNKI